MSSSQVGEYERYIDHEYPLGALYHFQRIQTHKTLAGMVKR
jgi:hypothetical protein